MAQAQAQTVTTERDVRQAIRDLIAAALPLSLVYNRWCLAYDPREWAGLLRSPADADRVNAWIVTRRSIAQSRIGNGCVRAGWSYAIWGFYGYATGDDTASSEDVFAANVDAVCQAFAPAPGLPEAVARNDQIQFPVIDLMSFGGELVHVAQGSLAVTPCCTT